MLLALRTEATRSAPGPDPPQPHSTGDATRCHKVLLNIKKVLENQVTFHKAAEVL